MRQLQKEVQNAEKKVEKLEAEAAQLEVLLADADYYNKPESQQTIKRHQEIQQEIEASMQAWEKAQSLLEQVTVAG